jgi:hypothetical protein
MGESRKGRADALYGCADSLIRQRGSDRYVSARPLHKAENVDASGATVSGPLPMIGGRNPHLQQKIL